MLNRSILREALRRKITTRILGPSGLQAGVLNFPTRRQFGDKKIVLDKRWREIAEKESKGKFNIEEKLIRETNEKMLIKPIYTSDDWSSAAKD